MLTHKVYMVQRKSKEVKKQNLDGILGMTAQTETTLAVDLLAEYRDAKHLKVTE